MSHLIFNMWLLPPFFFFFTGFGVSAPSTVAGKVLLVFYGLLGCSATILFFNLFLERVITLVTHLILQCQRSRITHRDQEKTGGHYDRKEKLKPSVYQVSIILFMLVMLVACAAASLYSAMEGWTYLESLYFCFVAFSTVGFGDLVSSQRPQHGETRAYQVANCLLMLLGVCCTYSLFSSISVIIKQGLSWLLVMMERLYDSIRNCGLQLRPLINYCFFSSTTKNTCYNDDNTLTRHEITAIYTCDRSMMWHSCAPSAIGRCLCGKTYQEIISNRIMWIGKWKQNKGIKTP